MTPEELDRWLAEELVWPGEKLCFEESHNGKTEIVMGICGCGGRYLHYWHPTSSIAQAFMCVEKMRERGWAMQLNTVTSTSKANAVFRKYPKTVAFADSNPATAICKAIHAALKEE